jgi:hypothetical protein
LARYVAPAVFLLAVTGIVLAVRAGLRRTRAIEDDDRLRPPARAPPSRGGPGRASITLISRATLGAIASRFGDRDRARPPEPGIEPTTLTPGEQIHPLAANVRGRELRLAYRGRCPAFAPSAVAGVRIPPVLSSRTASPATFSRSGTTTNACRSRASRS